MSEIEQIVKPRSMPEINDENDPLAANVDTEKEKKVLEEKPSSSSIASSKMAKKAKLEKEGEEPPPVAAENQEAAEDENETEAAEDGNETETAQEPSDEQEASALGDAVKPPTPDEIHHPLEDTPEVVWWIWPRGHQLPHLWTDP
ncbi:serine/threonine-protein phosphatase 4 regulatory subunit 2-like [Drosophila ficusphila]|uniref:serine/threonine-protein phosphatase 4 regulatory subunit 2-like n=1 Tax=Drosophila ficusphila TaxID=30025 RepID=UPI0007E5F441|nr:serine/threonine-protein phosphatase 4 regulatory subunit 2-like [Drosophila ficusphila]XP_017045491.1 serine/threonine-protein phosphatase 4 regulatory subunit 2-like [Drosophila ficusphila]